MKKTIDLMSKAFKCLLVFGFICSNLSFPIEVLAEELSNNDIKEQDESLMNQEEILKEISTLKEEDVLDEYVITVNGEETLEYTITDNKNVVINLEYQDEVVSGVELNFSNKLYGVYEFTFEEVTDKVVINYNGNNMTLLESYKNVVDTTKSITYNDKEVIIGGFGSELVTGADIKAYYNLSEFENDYNAKVVILNGENELLDTDTVMNGYLFNIVDNQTDENILNTIPVTSYEIIRAGDVFIPSDGLVDLKDQKQIVDDILSNSEVTSSNDVNNDGVLNILDATDSLFINNGITEEVTDVLTNELVSSVNEMYLNEEVVVKLLVSGFDKAMLYGIEGKLTYDKEILELVGVEVFGEESSYIGYENKGKFAYVFNNGFNNNEEALLTLKFESLKVGEAEVVISELLESYGLKFNSNDTASVKINVVEFGTGGDVEEEEPEENIPGDDKTEDDTTNDNVVNTDKKEEDKEVAVRPVVLSSDYYIKNLKIKGYDIDFDMYKYEYSIKVDGDVTSLDFDVLLNSNESIYYVEGNENFKEGENLVYLVVKAENGSTKTYTIKVLKEEEKLSGSLEDDKTEDDEEKEENSTSKTIIIILIILVIIGLIYVIFKDDEEDKKEVKKEVKKDDKPEIKMVEKKPSTNKNSNTTKSKNTSKNQTKKNNKKSNKK